MDRRDLPTYAHGCAEALRVIGPTPRRDVLAMLRGLRLTEREIEETLAYGLAHHVLVAEGDLIRAGSGSKGNGDAPP